MPLFFCRSIDVCVVNTCVRYHWVPADSISVGTITRLSWFAINCWLLFFVCFFVCFPPSTHLFGLARQTCATQSYRGLQVFISDIRNCT